MARHRSWLFVPGHRARMLDKVPAMEAEKVAARALVASRIAGLAGGCALHVRVNKSRHMYDFNDLCAVVQPGLAGIVLAMPNGPEDVALAAALIGEAEDRNGVAPGSVGIVPALETPRGLQLAHECALHPRVTALIGAYAKGADLERAMGLEWSAEGREALYLKSRVVLACRAAGKLPIGGIWQQIHDHDGLRRHAAADRALGFAGTTILHPSNAAVANAVFAPSPEQLAHFHALVAAYEAAEAAGNGAVMFAGEHIDRAHVATARQALSEAGE